MIRKNLALCAIGFVFSTTAVAQERVVNVYNWSDYVDPQVLENFTKETGIKVVYDTYDNNEIVETKLLAGKSNYDVVVPSAPFIQRLIPTNVLLPLDKTKLPNLKNVWPDIAERLATYDPGNRYAVNYMWGTTGYAYNEDSVLKILGDTAPVDSWDLVFKQEYSDKLYPCGVYMLDSSEDMFPTLLNYIGLDPDSKNEADLRKAAEALMPIRKNITKFHSSEYIDMLANGSICLAVGYSGDMLQARNRAEEAKNGVNIRYVIPKEGAMIWFDNLVIPADAPHPDEAHAFINYLLRPEVAAANSNFVSFASGVLAAKELVNKELLDDPGVYPGEDVMKRLFVNTVYGAKSQRYTTRLWTQIKSGL
ncbi:MAG: polyamine ABC transporter substrate-binding protein [Methylobacteriaceae bacterium]|jgi:putrescine transport system substrate-binding protein|nr:polyamine ABC transporter substrate-binding protein [Methylobacteriaceae bacterium]